MEKKSNNKRQAGKASSSEANNKQQQAKQATKPAQLTELEIAEILKSIIVEAGGYLTISALKKMEASLTEKYGKSNWISIRAYFQNLQKIKIETAASNAAQAVKDFGPALADAWSRISNNKDFQSLAAYLGISAESLAKQWGSGPAFISATYPALIGGMPASRKSYITAGGSYIVDAMQPAEISAAKVPAILIACISNIKRAAVKALRAAQAIAAVKPAIYEAGQVVGVYFAAKDEAGAIVKGEAATKQADTIAAAGVSGLCTLAEYRKQQRGQE